MEKNKKRNMEIVIMENAKKTICINNKKILINTNKKIIIDEIINYFKDYTSENKNLNIDFIS